MSLLSDILKEIPISSVLREKIGTIEAENESLKTEVAILKDDLREAKAENKRLKDEIDSLKHQGSHSNETLLKVRALLAAFRSSLPKHDMDKADAAEYNGLVGEAEKAVQRRLGEFYISNKAFKSRAIPNSVSYDIAGNPSNDAFSYEEYIPSAAFRRKLDALLIFLDSLSSAK